MGWVRNNTSQVNGACLLTAQNVAGNVFFSSLLRNVWITFKKRTRTSVMRVFGYYSFIRTRAQQTDLKIHSLKCHYVIEYK